MKSLKLVAAAAVTIVALAACGGSGTTPTGAGASAESPGDATSSAPAASDGAATSSPAASTAAVDTCALLTPADLSTAMGGDFATGVVDSAGQCVWDGDASVVLFVQDVTLDFIKSTFAGGVDTTVSGHAAYWNPAQGLQSLWVDVGDGRTLVLSFPKSSDLGPSDQSIAEQLAEIAIGGM